jgi:hypothetical protein
MQQHTPVPVSPLRCADPFRAVARRSCALLVLLLAACGGGGGGNGGAVFALPPVGSTTTPAEPSPPSTSEPETPPPETPSPLTIGGTVTGLKGSGLVLVNNGGDALAVSADGAFTFATALARGASYAVSVQSQPGGPSQVCTVNAGTGTVADAAVTEVKVMCATRSYAVGGTVSGLAGTGLVLQNNAADDLPVAANGGFVFPAAVASGAAYAVTVKTQPGGPTQLCSVAQGSGTIGADDVASVQVACATRTRAVNVTVSGLDGQGLVLQNNSGDDLAVDANGKRQFTTRVAEGSSYAVTVKSQPRMYTQFCTVGQSSGTAGAADVDDVSVACATPATKSVYVSSVLGGSLSTLTRYSGADLSGEALSIVPTIFTSLVADPKGRYVYGSGGSGIGIGDSGRIYAIQEGDVSDSVSFAAQEVGTLTLGMHPGGAYLYAASSAGWVSTYAVSPASPTTLTHLALRPVGSNGTSAWSMAVDPLGRFVFVNVQDRGLATLPILADGTLGNVAYQGVSDVVSIAVHPSGAYLYALAADGFLRTFSIDASTGALKQTALTLAMESFEAALASLSIDGRGRMLSLVDTTNDVQQTRAITDTTTGTLGAPFAIRGLRGPIATAFDPSREGVNYLVDSSNLYRRTIDPVAASYTHTSTVPLAPTIKAMVLLNR